MNDAWAAPRTQLGGSAWARTHCPPSALFNTSTAGHQLPAIAHQQLLHVVGQHQPLLLLVHRLLHQLLVDLVAQLELVGGGQLMVRCWCVGEPPDSHPPTKGESLQRASAHEQYHLYSSIEHKETLKSNMFFLLQMRNNF